MLAADRHLSPLRSFALLPPTDSKNVDGWPPASLTQASPRHRTRGRWEAQQILRLILVVVLAPEASDSLEQIQARIRAASPFGAERTEAVIRQRFRRLPQRLQVAMRHWPLGRARVLDVGCSFGHCLVHFGEGSLGIDNVPEHIEFCRALGLSAVLLDVDAGLDSVPDGVFDFAWVSDILEHVDAPRLLLRGLRPKLRADGELLVHLSTLPSWRPARGVFRSRGLAPFDAEAHHYQFTVDTAEFLLRRAGYRIVGVVPALPESLAMFERPARLFVRQLPRVFVSARQDADAERIALEAERRNKPCGQAA